MRSGVVAPTLHRTGTASGAPVLLLHPLGVDRSVWQTVAAGLREFTVLTCDLPGHGENPAWDRRMEVDEVAAQLATALLGTGYGPAHVVGVSLGGLVAQSLAAHHPEVVDRLVVVDAVDVYPPAMQEMWKDRADLVRAVGVQPVITATLELWFTAAARDTEGEVVEQVRRLLTSTDTEGYARACELLATVDTSPLLPRILARTLVVCGDDDAPAFTAAAPRLAAAVPHGTLAWIDHARHAGALERPEAFVELLRSFLVEETDQA